MAESDGPLSPTSSTGPQSRYRPPYRADPQLQPLARVQYPGMHYQLYPAALAPVGQGQLPRRRRHRGRAALLGFLALVLAPVLMLSMYALDANMSGNNNSRSIPTPQPVLAASLVNDNNSLVSTTSSAPAPDQMTTAALSIKATLNMPDTPVNFPALPAKYALNIPDAQATSVTPLLTEKSDTVTTPAVPMAASPVVGIPARSTGELAKSRSVPCSDALRALQLCREPIP